MTADVLARVAGLPFFAGLDGRPDEGMRRIEEIFHLE